MALRLASPKYRAVISPNNFFMSLLFNGSYFIFSTLQISGFSMGLEKDFSYFGVGISLSCKRGMILGKKGLIDFKKGGGVKREKGGSGYCKVPFL